MVGDRWEAGASLRVVRLANPRLEVRSDNITASVGHPTISGHGGQSECEFLLIGLELHFESEIGTDTWPFLPNEVYSLPKAPPILLHEKGNHERR